MDASCIVYLVIYNVHVLLLCFVGNHITLVAFSRYVGHCLEAANELAGQGVECEVNTINN
jgi:transketolase C-terminal domain/subunit